MTLATAAYYMAILRVLNESAHAKHAKTHFIFFSRPSLFISIFFKASSDDRPSVFYSIITWRVGVVMVHPACDDGLGLPPRNR